MRSDPCRHRVATAIGFWASLLAVSVPLAADGRSVERLSYACESDLGARDVTLFANGTVRLRQGMTGDRQLYLAELDPATYREYLRKLVEIAEAWRESFATMLPDVIEGAWIERCEVRLALPGEAPLGAAINRYDVLPLDLGRLIDVADELALLTEPPAQADSRLSSDYVPRLGDVLRTVDGLRFEILGFTRDGHGVELEGLDQPLRIFVAKNQLAVAFSRLEETE